ARRAAARRAVGRRAVGAGRRAGVRAVEAAALEDHADRAEQLAQRAGTLRALGQARVAERLNRLEPVVTLLAGVLVGGHRRLLIGKRWHSSGSSANFIVRYRILRWQTGLAHISTRSSAGELRRCGGATVRARRQPSHDTGADRPPRTTGLAAAGRGFAARHAGHRRGAQHAGAGLRRSVWA